MQNAFFNHKTDNVNSIELKLRMAGSVAIASNNENMMMMMKKKMDRRQRFVKWEKCARLIQPQ